MRQGGFGQMPAKDHPAGVTSIVTAGREFFWGASFGNRWVVFLRRRSLNGLRSPLFMKRP